MGSHGGTRGGSTRDIDPAPSDEPTGPDAAAGRSAPRGRWSAAAKGVFLVIPRHPEKPWSLTWDDHPYELAPAKAPADDGTASGAVHYAGGHSVGNWSLAPNPGDPTLLDLCVKIGARDLVATLHKA